MRGRTILATVALASALVSAASADTTRSEQLVRDIYESHNRERAKAKLEPLAPDPKLTAAAQAHAEDMAAHRKMTHDGSDGSSPSDRIRRQDYQFQNDGENVAEGYRTVEALMRGWMESPHHRENILGNFTQVGIAVARDEDGTPYWCADFATPWEKLDPARARADLVKALNKGRADAGLPPLVARAKLTSAASQIARVYADAESLHPKGRREDVVAVVNRLGYRYLRLADSAASGQPNVAEVVKTWMDSPPLSKHILGDFTEIGAGYADSRSGKPYWTLILARPRKN